MCRQIIAIPQAIVEEIVKDVETGRVAKVEPGWITTGRSAFPGAEVSVIVPEEECLKAREMLWGYAVSWEKKLIFNTRFDTATRPGGTMWTDSLEHRRCVVPTFGFYEPHQSETYSSPHTGKPLKQEYLFTLASSPVLFIAGVYENDRFSLMTTEPNSIVRPIHNRMPVVLEQHEIATWLLGDYLSLAERSAVKLVATKEG